MTQFFFRSGEIADSLKVQTRQNRHFIVTQDVCQRCGGEGGWRGWPGYTCFRCCGERFEAPRETPVYDAETLAKLVATQEKRDAKKAAKQAAKIARETEALDAAKAAFETSQPGLIAWAREQKSDFHQSLVEQFDGRGSLSEAQVSTLLRSRQQASERAAKVAQQAAISDHVGVIGDRHQFALTIRFVKGFESAFGMLFIHVMDDQQGNVIVYKGSKELGEKGQSLSLVATVSEHGEREGIKQTIIKRPKVA